MEHPAAARFVRLLVEDGRSIPSGPGRLLGAEQEFEVFEGGAKGDFRRLIDAVLASAALPAGALTYYLDTGTLVTCDGWEAEIAVPPVPAERGGCRRLVDLVCSQRTVLAGLVDVYGRATGRALSLRGYSTHLSAYCAMVDADPVCRLYATTMAPAMMLHLDLATSPGLLVRPRTYRFEIGGEYAGPADVLTAAAVFFLAARAASRAGLFLELAPPGLDFRTGAFRLAIDGPRQEVNAPVGTPARA